MVDQGEWGLCEGLRGWCCVEEEGTRRHWLRFSYCAWSYRSVPIRVRRAKEVAVWIWVYKPKTRIHIWAGILGKNTCSVVVFVSLWVPDTLVCCMPVHDRAAGSGRVLGTLPPLVASRPAFILHGGGCSAGRILAAEEFAAYCPRASFVARRPGERPLQNVDGTRKWTLSSL